ncbi:hypothetical protein GOODEAATRI_008139 [Goodea atripinnis]|uniref:Uncharacterized protein n=1 Tax=Goodea atripinnis TaxID=208336 RepID=A0ABV0MZM0_9TELE
METTVHDIAVTVSSPGLLSFAVCLPLSLSVPSLSCRSTFKIKATSATTLKKKQLQKIGGGGSSRPKVWINIQPMGHVFNLITSCQTGGNILLFGENLLSSALANL